MLCVIALTAADGFSKTRAAKSARHAATHHTAKHIKQVTHTGNRKTVASKKKGKRRRRWRRPVGPRLYSGVKLAVLSQTRRTLAPGVTFALKTISRNHWRVGVVHAKLTAGYHVALFKSHDRAVGFERVEDMVHRLDSTRGIDAVAAVNANFWRGGVGTMLGAAVCDGEVVGFDNYKQWSRLIVRRDGSMAITRDSVMAWIASPRAGWIPIQSINVRRADSGLVMYNEYFGPTLPPVDTSVRGDSLTPRRGLDSTTRRILSDTSELFYETDEDIFVIPDSLAPKPRSEEHTLKCMAVMLDSPRVNAPVRCRITAMTSRLVPILRRSIALSFPRSDSVLYHRLHTGDTITMEFLVGDGSLGDIAHMLMAGPRLVRDGRLSVETEEENFHRRSYISGGHARTAIGFNEAGDEVILVTVDRPMGTRKAGRPGIGLSDLGRILLTEGAYDAMNFDGGSSTTLVVNGKTVIPDTGKEFSRHVASVVAIVKGR